MNKIEFEKNIEKLESGCWLWKGKTRSSGRYGYLMIEGVAVSSHRFSFELYKERIIIGNVICHTCDNGLCVNPDHLFQGTYKDNMQDCISKGRFKFNTTGVNQIGNDNPNVKLTESEVLAIRKYYSENNCTYQEIVDVFNLKSRGHAAKIIKREIWTHI